MQVRLIVLLAGIFLCQNLHSQTLSQSPYGRYAIGDVLPTTSAQLQALGGVTQVFADSNCLNPAQPASLTSLSAGATVFEAGLIGLSTHYKTGNQDLVGRTSGFGYFGLAFPLIRKKWSAGIYLSPLSNAGYVLKDTVFNAPEGQINFAYKGTGGFSSFSFIQSAQISKDFAVGLSVRYLFGKTDYSSEVTFPGDPNVRSSRITSSSRINDVDFTAGLTFQHRFRKPGYRAVRDTSASALLNTDSLANVARKKRPDRDSLHLKFGATFTPSVRASASDNYLAEAFLESTVDTILLKDKIAGRITTPMQAGAGFVISNCYNRWLFTTDFVYTDWSGFRMFDRIDSVRSSYRISAGLQIFPGPDEKFSNKKLSYFKRIRYRFGGYYSDGNLRLYNQNVAEMGLSIGIGLPVKIATYARRPATSLLNISVTAGQRGTPGKNVLTEQFIRVTVGFSLNDRWFNKSKID